MRHYLKSNATSVSNHYKTTDRVAALLERTFQFDARQASSFPGGNVKQKIFRLTVYHAASISNRLAVLVVYLAQVFRSRGLQALLENDQLALVYLGLESIISKPSVRGKVKPARLEAYRLIQKFIPNFGWTVTRSRLGKPVVRFQNYPTVAGKQPSIQALVAHVLGIKTLDFKARAVDPVWQPLLDLGEAGVALREFIGEVGVTPPALVVNSIANWLTVALSGSKSTLVCAVCPDWEVGEDGRYTFSGLGSGVGLVAQRALAKLPAWEKFCLRWGLNVSLVVAIGDFEATEEACARVGLTTELFMQRLRLSQNAFAQASTEVLSLPLLTPFITELGPWLQYYDEARQLLTFNNYSGSLRWSAHVLDKIAQARSSLYKRWFKVSKVNATELALKQGAEYAAIGKVIQESSLDNPLILAFDHDVMTPFWQALLPEPVALVYHKGQNY